MKTIKQLTEMLAAMGCSRKFKPYKDLESTAILLEVRLPAKIIDGRFNGSEIDVYDQSTFRIWTAKRRKAKEYAIKHNLKIRMLDGECELFVPGKLADEILPAFGAKVKRQLTERQEDDLKARFPPKKTSGPQLGGHKKIGGHTCP